MTLLQIIILAFVQGLTEFLPVSSSAHLILIPSFLGWTPQEKVMDVAFHVGTLGAVIVYFRQDLKRMILYIPSFLTGHWKTQTGCEMLSLIIATLPAVVVGWALSEFGLTWAHSFGVIGIASLFFGGLLYRVDQQSPALRPYASLTLKDAWKIGLAQILAFIPGASRSGMCLIMARFLNFQRPDAAKFTFLLSIPVIIAAATNTGYKAFKSGEWAILEQAIWGIGFAFIAGLGAIHFMMWWLQRSRFTPFAVYRMILGIILILLSFQ